MSETSELIVELVARWPSRYHGWTSRTFGEMARAHGIKTVPIGRRDGAKVSTRHGIRRAELERRGLRVAS